MHKFIKSKLEFFKRDTSGSVTVDWVVLTAAVIALGIGVIAIFANGTTGAAAASNENLTAAMASAASVN